MCHTNGERASGCSLGQVGAGSLGVCRHKHSNGCACISPRVLGQETARWGHRCDSVHSPQSSDLLLIRPPSGVCRRGHIAQWFPGDTLASGAFSELHRLCPPSPGCGLHHTVNPLPLLMIFLSLDADLFQCCVSTSALTSKARLSCCPATVALLLSGTQVFLLTGGSFILSLDNLGSRAGPECSLWN